jgi:hypothetical protein
VFAKIRRLELVKINILAEYAALEAMDTKLLLKEWGKYFEDKPQSCTNRSYIINNIIYRIQELAYGGLTRRTIDRLEALAEREKISQHNDNHARLALGTMLVREYKGVEHQVTVISDGYEYNGMKYKSLSGAAYAITGTRWNGHVFFGLGKKENPRSYHRNRKKAAEKARDNKWKRK